MKILIYGGGLLGKQIYYVIKTYFEEMKVVGFIDDVLPKKSEIVDSLVNIGSLEEVSKDPNFSSDKVNLVFAIGYKTMIGRKKAYHRAKQKGYKFERIIHPNAFIEKNVELGEGTIVLSGAVLDQYVKVGEINYFAIGALIAENGRIGSNNFFAANCTVGGSAVIGEDNFLGLNTTIVDNINIGNNNYSNAKTLIYKNMEDNLHIIETHQIRTMRRKNNE